MSIEHFIIFCGAQIIGLQFILLRKKFRTFPNLMLMLVLTNITIHYVFYYFHYKGLIENLSLLSFLIVPLATVAPLLVYYYVLSTIYGSINFKLKSILHLLPFIINTFVFVLYADTVFDRNILLAVAKYTFILLYAIYPIIIVKTLSNFYEFERISLKVFKFNKKKTSMVRLLVTMMSIHFIIMLIKTSLPFFTEGTENIMNIINLSFLMILGYAITYVIISEPKSIQLIDEKVGLGGFKKYRKSNLSRVEAEKNVKILNDIMEKEKPFLNPDFNLKTFSSLSSISQHTISETLNGLVGQSFNDYVNNYRVEEFKKIASNPNSKNYTILAMAFEAGFKSKATFNAAFKKLTKKTPSQYLKSL